MIDAGPPPGESEAGNSSPELPASAIFGARLPTRYTPKIAAYAPGPFLTPELVTPSEWTWRNARTFTITQEGIDYRAIRVSSGGKFIGYWMIEQLGIPLGLEGL